MWAFILGMIAGFVVAVVIGAIFSRTKTIGPKVKKPGEGYSFDELNKKEQQRLIQEVDKINAWLSSGDYKNKDYCSYVLWAKEDSAEERLFVRRLVTIIMNYYKTNGWKVEVETYTKDSYRMWKMQWVAVSHVRVEPEADPLVEAQKEVEEICKQSQ